MKQNAKILNNSYNNEEFGMDRTDPNSTIAVHPSVANIYEESTTDDIMSVLNRKQLYEILYDEYLKSEWYTKYNINKKIEKNDLTQLYYDFKIILIKNNFNAVEIFCGIAEFFKLNYKILYNDIISVEDKSNILNTLKEDYGITGKLDKSMALF